MNPAFEQLLTDPRLLGVFNEDAKSCVMQVWLLEYKSKQETSIRWLYGRALPADYSAGRWTGSINGKAMVLTEQSSLRILPFTAFISTTALRLFSECLSAGMSLLEASDQAGIQVDSKLAGVLGAAAFGSDVCIRPIMHLPTRDYYRFVSKRLSPSSYGSYDSGALTRLSKESLFLDFGVDNAGTIARSVCDALDADTGLDFAVLDAWRLGDFEFLCAPSLNESERSKYRLKTKGDFASVQILEPFTNVPCKLLVVLKSFSDGCLQSTHIATVEKDVALPFEVRFHIDTFKEQIATAVTLEVFSQPEDSSEAFLCLQTGNFFVRTMNMEMRVHQSMRIEGKTDWLAKQVPARAKGQLEDAKAIQRSSTPSRSVIGGHKDDPWVDVNRGIAESLALLLPKKSSARFFPKLSDSEGMSRLQLVAWLRETFSAHPDAQIAWFDPFIEDVGIDLLHRIGTFAGDYVMFTSEKQAKADGVASSSDSDQQQRIKNLLQKCNEWGSSSFGNVHLRVIALPANKLHDRMVLIRSRKGIPLAGYQVSNSIQMANENHPLLVTPIPSDILPAIFTYMDDIIDATFHSQPETDMAEKVLFDSRTQAKQEVQVHTECTSLLDLPRAGDVFAWWLELDELRGLSGANLAEVSNGLGLIEGEEICESKFENVPEKLWEKGFDLEPFHDAWDAMGELLASVPAGELYRFEGAQLTPELEHSLLRHLDPNRRNSLLPSGASRRFIDLDYYFSLSLHEHLKTGDDPERTFSYAPSEVEYGDYYAIVLLWLKSPTVLAKWLRDQVKNWPIGEKTEDASLLRQRALITTTLRHICSYPYLGSKTACIRALLSESCPITQWMGLHILKSELDEGKSGLDILDELNVFPTDVRTKILCWLINEANYQESDSLSLLVERLTLMIETPLRDTDLKEILDPVRGRLGRLHHITPWILEALLVPMLERGVIKPAQVATQWLGDLTAQWLPGLKGDHLSFRFISDGAFTDELAILFGFLEEGEQKPLVTELQRVFAKSARIIRVPLATQVSWTSYSRAHQVNLWIYSLALRMKVFAVHSVEESLSSLLEDCSGLMNRLSPSYRDALGNEELIKYSMGDPEQLRSHRLLKVIEEAVKEE
ncbi:VPA1262 family protein [Pseudomonas alkylphenolica]|uniref:Uncharacterized protein n=1 Tax=Pseudomonas alkylphenolica TaxID=237609 RepID=A0A077FCJ5_9PSED|nr:VPA1262 family protein [Pseudomonas alkylphenolica]AIL63097.1 hypothetical protein PSAKL28_39490 [Pseudomonas alkylphenolica]